MKLSRVTYLPCMAEAPPRIDVHRPVHVIIDPADSLEVAEFVGGLHDLEHGRLVCHPLPGGTGERWLALDLLAALAKDVTGFGAVLQAYERKIAAARRQLGEDVFMAAWAAGNRWLMTRWVGLAVHPYLLRGSGGTPRLTSRQSERPGQWCCPSFAQLERRGLPDGTLRVEATM
jgi:hypothetical protein